MELYIELLAALCGVISVTAAVYNVLTAYRRAKQLAQENRQAVQQEATLLLATRTEQRVNALENRFGSFENRIERRIEQIAGDIGQVKDLFTNYLINKH